MSDKSSCGATFWGALLVAMLVITSFGLSSEIQQIEDKLDRMEKCVNE